MRLGLFASAFDPFPHPGHLWSMRQAIEAGACDGILAAVHVDPSVERPEKRKPALHISDRMMLLGAIQCVKRVVFYGTEADLGTLMQHCRPAVRIIGEDHKSDHNTGDDLDPPIPVFWAARKPEWSGTEFSKRIAISYFNRVVQDRRDTLQPQGTADDPTAPSSPTSRDQGPAGGVST